MAKTEVYSWRLTPELKTELEAAARRKKVGVATVLERAAQDWLRREKPKTLDAEEQKRMRATLMAVCGSISGDGTSATNDVVRKVMGEALERKYGRRRSR